MVLGDSVWESPDIFALCLMDRKCRFGNPSSTETDRTSQVCHQTTGTNLIKHIQLVNSDENDESFSPFISAYDKCFTSSLIESAPDSRHWRIRRSRTCSPWTTPLPRWPRASRERSRSSRKRNSTKFKFSNQLLRSHGLFKFEDSKVFLLQKIGCHVDQKFPRCLLTLKTQVGSWKVEVKLAFVL